MSDLDNLPPPRTEPLATLAPPARPGGLGVPPPPPPVAPGRVGPPPFANASVAWTIVAVVAVALAAAAGGAIWRPRGDEVDRASATVRALVGAGVGGLVAATLLFVLRRRRLALPAAIITAVAALAIALGAILGAASAPTEQPAARNDDARPEQPQPANPGEPRPRNEISENAEARLVDANGDGRPDRDANGNLIIAFDGDGDGSYESRLVRCPDSSITQGGSADSSNIQLDLGCDGDIDGTIPLNPELLEYLPSWTDSERELVFGEPGNDDGNQGATGGNDDNNAGDSDNDRGGSGGLGDVLKPILLTLLVLATAGVVAYAITTLLRRRTAKDESATESEIDPADEQPEADAIDTAAVDAALEESIETLLGHPDPRLAIRAAYAVLLDALAECGFARRSFEAPEEHLTRCLTGLSVEPTPMRELLRLFSVARFSTHDVTEDDRAAALAALRQSQDVLRHRTAELASAAVPPGPERSP